MVNIIKQQSRGLAEQIISKITKRWPITGALLCLPILLPLLLLPTKAHGDDGVTAIDVRPVRVSFHLKGLSADWFSHQVNEKSITLNKAYLASFSLNLVPCLIQEKPKLTNIGNGFLDALLPKAYANHGVRFDMPTQIPLMLGHDLSQDSSHLVGEFMLPLGRYCELNYTMAHITSAKPLTAMTPYSLYLDGELNESVITSAADIQKQVLTDNHQAIELSARYAYGQNVAVNFEVTAATRKTHTASLAITLAPEAAFRSILTPNKLDQAKHLLVRELLLAIPKQLKIEYSEITTNN